MSLSKRKLATFSEYLSVLRSPKTEASYRQGVRYVTAGDPDGFLSLAVRSKEDAEDTLIGFTHYVPFLELISIGNDEVIVRDNKKDRIFGVKAKSGDNGKVRFYCEMDETDYRPHTAFAAALPQVRNALRR